MSDSIEGKIDENARKPKRIRRGDMDIEQHGLKDQIEADRYLASKQAMRGSVLPLRRAKIVPPGAV